MTLSGKCPHLGMCEIGIYNACLTKIPFCAVIDLKYLVNDMTKRMIRSDIVLDMVWAWTKLVFRMSKSNRRVTN